MFPQSPLSFFLFHPRFPSLVIWPKFILSQIPLQSEKWHFGLGTSRMVKLMNGHQMSLIRLMCSPSLQLQLSPWDLTCWQPLFLCVCACLHLWSVPQRVSILNACVDVPLLLFIYTRLSWEDGPKQKLHSNSAALCFWWGQLSAVGDSAVPVTPAPSRPSVLPIWQPDTRRRHCTKVYMQKIGSWVWAARLFPLQSDSVLIASFIIPAHQNE